MIQKLGAATTIAAAVFDGIPSGIAMDNDNLYWGREVLSGFPSEQDGFWKASLLTGDPGLLVSSKDNKVGGIAVVEHGVYMIGLGSSGNCLLRRYSLDTSVSDLVQTLPGALSCPEVISNSLVSNERGVLWVTGGGIFP
jgi:hypothetical protein